MDWRAIPPLAALRAFDALARHGSFSAAARALNVTHAAISQHVRALENEFGEPLAIRQGQSMQLTPAGQELAKALGDGFDRIADGVAQIRSRHEDRPVTVTLTPSFAESWLMPRIGDFWSAHPDVDLRLVPSINLVDLRRDGIDIAIRFGDGDWPGYDVVPLVLNRFIVVGSPKLIEEGKPLDAYKWLFSSHAHEQEVWGRQIGIEPDQIDSEMLANNGMVISAARAGLGLSVQAQTLVELDLERGDLVALSEGQPDGLGYHLVTRKGVPSPGVKLFVTWLQRQAQV